MTSRKYDSDDILGFEKQKIIPAAGEYSSTARKIRIRDELATVAIGQYEAETRFRSLAERLSSKVGLALLDKLDRANSKPR